MIKNVMPVSTALRKSRFVDQARWRSGLATLVVRRLAAALAYAAGAVLQGIA